MDRIIGRHCPRAIAHDVMREAITAVLDDPRCWDARSFRWACEQLVLGCVPLADKIQQVSDIVNLD